MLALMISLKTVPRALCQSRFSLAWAERALLGRAGKLSGCQMAVLTLEGFGLSAGEGVQQDGHFSSCWTRCLWWGGSWEKPAELIFLQVFTGFLNTFSVSVLLVTLGF